MINQHIPWTEEKRLAITAAIMTGADFSDIARQFDTKAGTVTDIKLKRRWFKDLRNKIIQEGVKSLSTQQQGQ